MKFSVWPDPSLPVGHTIELARWADQHGWYGVWFADHYMVNTFSTEVVRGDVHECWSVLAALAVATEHVRLGPLVSPTSVHHPALLANRAITIDHLSNGRMVLGLGAGWQINEHAAYGIELEPPGKRVDRFVDAIQVIRSLLDHDVTDFAGPVYTMTGAIADPKPVQPHLPLLVGTGSKRMLETTARYADEWNTWGASPLAIPRRAAFEQACQRVGRDPHSMHTSVQAVVQITDDGRPPEPAERSITGSAQYVVDQIGELADLGFDEFIVPTWGSGDSLQQALDALDRFDTDIRPHLAS